MDDFPPFPYLSLWLFFKIADSSGVAPYSHNLKWRAMVEWEHVVVQVMGGRVTSRQPSAGPSVVKIRGLLARGSLLTRPTSYPTMFVFSLNSFMLTIPVALCFPPTHPHRQ